MQSNQWGAGWGSLSPFLRAWAQGKPYYANDKDAPWYQSPYASDPSSSSARAAAGLDPTFDRSKIDYVALAKAQMQKMLGKILPGYFGTSGGTTTGGSGGTTGGMDLSKYYTLYRDDQGMIHDFGDNPIASQLDQLGNTSGNPGDIPQGNYYQGDMSWKNQVSTKHGGYLTPTGSKNPAYQNPFVPPTTPSTTVGEYNPNPNAYGVGAYIPGPRTPGVAVPSTRTPITTTPTVPPPTTTTTPPPATTFNPTAPGLNNKSGRSRWSIF